MSYGAMNVTKAAVVVWMTTLLGSWACDGLTLEEVLRNQTAPLGPPGADEVAGAGVNSGNRGTIAVTFINNTPFRAIFTYGAYDNTDEVSTPAFFQFSPDSAFRAFGASATLEGGADEGPFDLPCARVFAVGSRSLINLIDANPGPNPELIDEPGLQDGVGFSDAAFDSDEAAVPNQGFAAGVEALIGVHFDCGDALQVTLDFSDRDANNFRVDIEVVSAADGS